MTREKIEEAIIFESYANAQKWLRKNKIPFRTVKENDMNYIITCDFNQDRVNLTIKDLYITEISYG